METRDPIEGSFGSEIPSIYNQWGVMDAWSRKTLNFFKKFKNAFWKNEPLQ